MEKHHEYAAKLMRLLRECMTDLPDDVRHAVEAVESAALTGDDKKLIAAAYTAAVAAAYTAAVAAAYTAINANPANYNAAITAYYAAAYAYAANAIAAHNAAAFAVAAGVPADRVQKLRELLDV